MAKHLSQKRDKHAYQFAQQIGKLAEILIYLRYRISGWYLVKWRYRTSFGEIDLIIKRGAFVRFVEVKYRRKFISADSPVSTKQLRRLHNAALFATHHLPALQNTSYQCDIVVVTSWGRCFIFENHILPSR